MFQLLSSNEASSLDKSLIEKYGLSERALVSNAALGAYENYKFLFVGKRVLFVVGKGNNGSDALALASLVLPVAEKVKIYCHYDSGNEENEYRKRVLPRELFVDGIEEADTIVDGLFGVRYRLNIDEKTKEVIDKINKSSAVVLSLDTPSCYLIKADYTITFMCYKGEMFDFDKRSYCGSVKLFNPGFPHHAVSSGNSFLLEESDYKVKSFDLSDYKNTRGHVIVVGGSTKYPGAPILSALSAFHTGAGKVSVVSTPLVRKTILSSYPSIMASNTLIEADSYVVGPGWNKGSRKLLEEVVEKKKPVVVDADGIKLLGGVSLSHNGVVTPHIGEFRTLLKVLGIDNADIEDNIKSAARVLEAVVVLKGPTVMISDGDKLYVVDGANPSLGVAGSGDVLSGIIGSFLALGMNVLESAVNGSLLHQKSGRILSDRLGFYSAEDLIEEIGRNR